MLLSLTSPSGQSFLQSDNNVWYITPNGAGSILQVYANGSGLKYIEAIEAPSAIAGMSNKFFAVTEVDASINPSCIVASITFGSKVGNFIEGENILINSSPCGFVVSDDGSTLVVNGFSGAVDTGTAIIGETSKSVAIFSSATYQYKNTVTPYINGDYVGGVVPYNLGGINTILYENPANASVDNIYVSETQAYIEAAVNNTVSGSTIYQLTLNNNGTAIYTDEDIAYSVPAGLTSFDGANLIGAFVSGILYNEGVVDPILPNTIDGQIEFAGAPSGEIIIIISI